LTISAGEKKGGEGDSRAVTGQGGEEVYLQLHSGKRPRAAINEQKRERACLPKKRKKGKKRHLCFSNCWTRDAKGEEAVRREARKKRMRPNTQGRGKKYLVVRKKKKKREKEDQFFNSGKGGGAGEVLS